MHSVTNATAPLKVGHFSDLHYGPKNLAEADRCFAAAVDAAIDRGIDVAVVSGDATDHALNLHSPAVQALAGHIRRLADRCPVLMLQGTYSHEPPGTLGVFRLLAGRYPVHVAERIAQVVLTGCGEWIESAGWRFDELPAGARALFTCVPTVNKASVAAVLGATEAAEGVGVQLQALLAGYASRNRAARDSGIPTIGISHGTVSGCITEHGVPMAGFDHEFTTGALFAAQTDAFLLGHIHKHQVWTDCGRKVAYAGSIGRFHHGEIGEKGWLLWQVQAGAAEIEQVRTPARRTLDLVFDGKPDLERIAQAVAAGEVEGASVRVRWTVATEDRHEVDRAAVQQALAGAADVQMEARIVPVQRSRSEGISRAATLQEKVQKWAQATAVRPEPLIERLAALSEADPHWIAERILAAVEVPAPTANVAAEQVQPTGLKAELATTE